MPVHAPEHAHAPQGKPVLQIQALPRDTNVQGDLYGGWLVMQMDLAGSITAREYARGRVATVAIDSMVFLRPAAVGDLMSFHTRVDQIGKSSLGIVVEVWLTRPGEPVGKLTEGVFTFVAIDSQGRTRPLPA